MYTKDAIYYDKLNRELQTEDLPFYAAVIPPEAKRVCEVACGTGRILFSLAAAGRSLCGVDLSEQMLEIAGQKAVAAGLEVELLLGDMRRLPDFGTADVVICGYNALQHLCRDGEAAAFLRAAGAQLAAGGMIILDVFNPDQRFLHPEGFERVLTSFTKNGELVEVTERTLYRPESRINEITYLYTVNGSFAFAEEYAMRQYPPEELDALILSSDLRILEKYGDYDRSPFAPSSPKQIYLLGR